MLFTAHMDFYLARVADKLGRPQDVIRWMNRVVDEKKCLDTNERNLWASGYREYAAGIRNSLRALSGYRDDCTEYQYQLAIDELMDRYREELSDITQRAIRTIDSTLIPGSTKNLAAGVYQKVKADMLRYSAEFAEGQDRQDKVDRSVQAYRSALQLVSRDVTKANPLFLSIALNYAVCEVELCGRVTEAIEYAEQLFKEAVKSLDGLNPDDYDESTGLLQLLRDNVTRWREPKP